MAPVMKSRFHVVLALSLALAGNAYALPKWFHSRSKKNVKADLFATVVVDSRLPGCRVDIDGEGSGLTGVRGVLSVKSVDPGDHYLHVQCPGQREMSYFIRTEAGQEIQVDARTAATSSQASQISPLAAAEAKRKLRRMVSQAVQLRASGQFKEAVELLRKATQLDPRNGDLHRELGITFMMFHDWERARVEMLEAIHLEPNRVEAHSGLAFALEKLGDLQQALKEYRICTQMDPHDTSYRDHYVEVLGMLYTQKARKKR